jgi:hypothetical protein
MAQKHTVFFTLFSNTSPSPSYQARTRYCTFEYADPCMATTFVQIHQKGLQYDHISVLGIRIRMSLGLPDPDPLVRGMDPDPDQASDPSLFS